MQLARSSLQTTLLSSRATAARDACHGAECPVCSITLLLLLRVGHIDARSPTAGGGGWGGVPDDLHGRRRGCCGRNKWIAAGCVTLFLVVFFRLRPAPTASSSHSAARRIIARRPWNAVRLHSLAT